MTCNSIWDVRERILDDIQANNDYLDRKGLNTENASENMADRLIQAAFWNTIEGLQRALEHIGVFMDLDADDRLKRRSEIERETS